MAPIALLPAAALLARARRRRRTLAALGLAPPAAARLLAPAAAATVGIGLLVLAAAQPVLVHASPLRLRTDAELYVVIDNSRSMSARPSLSAPSRFERAQRFAVELRQALPEIPMGVASFTDRMLLHLLPTGDAATFDDTVRQAIGIDRPQPENVEKLSTSYVLLGQLGGSGTFAPSAKHRLLVLLTDGESASYRPQDVLDPLRRQRIGLVLVRFWSPRDRVYVRGADAGYRPDPASTAPFDELGRRSAAGRVFGPGGTGAVAAFARRYFGSGPTVAVERRRRARPLAPYAAIAALLPLGAAVTRRGGGSSAPGSLCRRSRSATQTDARETRAS